MTLTRHARTGRSERAALAGLALCVGVFGCGDADNKDPVLTGSPVQSSTTTDADAAASQPAGSVELAPSQVAASTVAPPTVPDPCDPADVETVVAEVDGEADQVIDLVNRGSARCEIDISASPNADQDLEPSVVLDPGQVAHMWISDVADCDGAAAAGVSPEFDLRINGSSRVMGTTFTPTCGVELWAFFSD